jgi:SulP family sulfate permease
MKLFTAIRPLHLASVGRDALAALTLAAVNIPQVLGYTRIAGTPIVTGLYTLLLPLVAFAALGSSRHLVVAADSATAAIFASGLYGMAPVASARYLALVGAVALLTAAFLLLARLFRLGFLADFLSRTVLVGFLTGVGIQIAVAMLGEMLGMEVRGHRTLEQVAEVFELMPRANGPTMAISVVVVTIILGCRHLRPKFPGALFAVVAGIAASAAWDFGARGIVLVGPVPGGLPDLSLPLPTWRETIALAPLAISCSLVVIAQSAATARAFASRHHERVDEDADLLGLAAANLAAAASGAFVVNGSPTQTATADTAGARSQVAQLALAAIVVIVLLFLTGPLAELPRAVLAAVVFTIGIGLIDAAGLRDILRESPGEFVLALVTAGTVALVGVEQGILLAMLLSLLRHVRHSYRPHTAILTPGPDGHWLPSPADAGGETAPGLIVYRFDADLFYANDGRFTEEIENLIEGAPERVRWLVVDAAAITNIDYSAARTVRDLFETLRKRGVEIAFARVRAGLRADMERHGIVEVIGESAIFAKLHEAVAAVRAADPELDRALTRTSGASARS